MSRDPRPDEGERRTPQPCDLTDPRFDVIWEFLKRLDVDFGAGLRSGATGDDVCAILDRLDRLEHHRTASSGKSFDPPVPAAGEEP